MDRQPCPVCGAAFPVDELATHVDLHFVEDQQPDVVDLLSEQEASPAVQSKRPRSCDPDTATDLVTCPYGCGAQLALDELDSHVLAHSLQEDEAEASVGDIERQLRQQDEEEQFEKLRAKYGFSDKRPGKCHRCGQEGHWSRECPSNPATRPTPAPLPTDPTALAAAQRQELYTPLPGGGLTALISRCLRQQCIPGASSYLCGPVDHLSARPQDSGWGCGFRNLQMLTSHLLARSPALRSALFGGRGFVPDIPALQAWVEAAWAAGYDSTGAESLGCQLQATRKWVGTTEAAAALRQFGVRAEIVDFRDKPGEAALVVCDACGQRVGPTRWSSTTRPDYDLCDTCHSRGAGDPGARPYRPMHYSSRAAGPSSSSGGGSGGGGGGGGGDGSSAGSDANQDSLEQQQQARHKQLVDWIWRYFSTAPRAAPQGTGTSSSGGEAGPSGRLPGAPVPGQGDGMAQEGGRRGEGGGEDGLFGPLEASGSSSGGGRGGRGGGRGQGGTPWDRPSGSTVGVVTTRPPLYLQHDGHSRTVVGIERRPGPQRGPNSGRPQYSLLVLDPGVPRTVLEQALRNGKDWQKHLKRGLHTLRKPEYQLLYVLDGLVPPSEAAAWKVLKAAATYTAS